MTAPLDRYTDRLGAVLEELALRQASELGEVRAAAQPGRRGPANNRGRRAALALTAAAIAIAGAAMGLNPVDRTRRPPTASAAELLRRVATRAGQHPAALDRGAYQYTRARITMPGGSGTAELWIANDGSGREVVRDPGNRVVSSISKSTSLLTLPDGTPVTPDQLERIAAVPKHLDDLLLTQARHLSRESPGFTADELRPYAAFELLRVAFGAPLAPGVRTGLLRALARLPRLEVVSRHTAELTVATQVRAVEFSATISLRDGSVLKVERRLTRRSPQVPGPPRVVSSYVLQARAAVTSQRARPPRHHLFAHDNAG